MDIPLYGKLYLKKNNMTIDEFIPELGTTIGEELLKPTRIYTKTVRALVENFNVKGMAHITGGGFYENIPRIIPEGLTACIHTDRIDTPEIFKLMQKWGNIHIEEMYSTFNMGIGMVVIVSKEEAEEILNLLEEQGEEGVLLGEIEKGQEKIVLW